MPFNRTVSQISESNGNRRASSGSDITMSSSESSSGAEMPWQPQIKNETNHQAPPGLISSLRPHSEEHQRSRWGWLGSSALEASTDDSPREITFARQNSEDSSDIVAIEKLKSEVAALSRQAEMSELELQTLRKQIVKESKKGQDLFRELVCLKEERDVLKGECEKLKSQQQRKAKVTTGLQFEGEDSKAIVEELRQELNHAKEINANLQIQLQKTQESNSELILAVRDLDDMLEQKNKEILNLSNGSLDEKSREGVGPANQSDDEEQKALEEIVKEHGDAREVYLLEQQIIDLRGELEIYKRDRDELEMQMEQLALDYEIVKQENHEMAYKLEQSQLQEQLKMQYECSSSYASAQELETQIENLENELKRRSKESEDSLAMITVLEAQIRILEEELEKQSKGFEADLEALMRSKVEQEQRAIKAEETLRKTRWKNASSAERIQEEFRRLSVQMASTFEANEMLATKAIAEANELRLQKSRLEEMISRASEEHELVKGDYEARLDKLACQVRLMTNQIEEMQLEIDDRGLQLEQQKKHAVETERLLKAEILKLKGEIEEYMAENKILLVEIGSKESVMDELAQMRKSVEEMELLMKQGKYERMELEKRIILVKSDSEGANKELNKMRCVLEEKELMIGNLESELDSLQSLCTELKHSREEDELEKDKLRKQVFVLKGDLKKEDASSKTSKPVHRESKEVANLKDRIKLLEGHIKLKENALEASSNAFLEKEKDLRDKIGELEGRLEVLNQSCVKYCENEVEKVATLADAHNPNFRPSNESRNGFEDSIDANSFHCSKDDNIPEPLKSSDNNNTGHLDELTKEMIFLKEKNQLMEGELKEMQERYSEISLKFAEVEGERQQLVMKVRNLKNAKKKA